MLPLPRHLLALVVSVPAAALAQHQCGGQASGASCPSHLCCSSHGYCGSTSDYCGGGCQGGPCWSNDYHYCGASFADANSKCARGCPGGVDSECLNGEKCFAMCTACPPTAKGGVAPSRLGAPAQQYN